MWNSWTTILIVSCFLKGDCSALDVPTQPKLDASPNEAIEYLSNYLSYFDCNLVDAFNNISSIYPNKRRYFLQQPEISLNGGFGAQVCLYWIPKTINSLFFGSSIAFNVAEESWNYGCPGYEKANDVLVNTFPRDAGEQSARLPTHDIVFARTTTLPIPLMCNGREITVLELRNAAAKHYFKFQPYFTEKIENEIKKLNLPKEYFGVHIRGGDKLVSEWVGQYAGLGKTSLWASKIAQVVEYDQTKYPSPTTTNSNANKIVFAESDDCNLLLDLKKQLKSYNIDMIHMPCQLQKPALYIQRGYSQNITGHHQMNWNSEHSCSDTIRYFTGLKIFEDANAVLLGRGGVDGTPLAGHGGTSNTVLLIELLRGKTNDDDNKKRTYNMINGRGDIVYPDR
mmetsp:Transcript_36095/g.46522  ORF Transcript_36095/g.46522 Transcript_36095/m.46522 type:complete len:396 (+) Transcript_36095:64-1251(+)